MRLSAPTEKTRLDPSMFFPVVIYVTDPSQTHLSHTIGMRFANNIVFQFNILARRVHTANGAVLTTHIRHVIYVTLKHRTNHHSLHRYHELRELLRILLPHLGEQGALSHEEAHPSWNYDEEQSENVLVVECGEIT